MQISPLSHVGWLRACAVAVAVLVAVPVAYAADSSSEAKSSEQLEQLVAPIALYPDALLSQVLMASTYPLEIVEAARWVKANPKLEDKALEDALQKQSWDPSVKSLAAFPQTLEMMNDKLSWTTELGDAFLAQQKDVMNSVQVLRQKAKAEGNIESNDQQTVKVEDTATGSQTQTIIIQPTNPKVVYVPTYNPMVIYGPWPYPAYRPFYWYPPGYVVTTSMISFGVGFTVGAAMWGGCNWRHSTVNINVNKYNSFNRTNIKKTTWKHDSRHRRGVAYGNRDLQKRYGGRQANNQKARESFRGRAEQGRQKIANGDADRFKGKKARDSFEGASPRTNSGKRADAARKTASASRGQRGGDGWSNRGGGAFEGMGNGHEARRNSNRGWNSRGGGGGGGGRWSGGGRRGGGGRRR